MNKIVCAWALLMITTSMAMEISKRGREDSSYESSDDENNKQSKSVGKKSVQKHKVFAVSPSDVTEVISGSSRTNFTSTYMRILVKESGVDQEKEFKDIQLVGQQQDIKAVHAKLKQAGKELKQHNMQCPSCDKVLQSDNDKTQLHRLVFLHWYTTRTHQMSLYDQMVKLLADSPGKAKANYTEHRLPTAAVVPFPALVVEDEPVQIQEELQADEQKEWYILEPHPEYQGMFVTFYADSHKKVIEQYLAAKLATLSLESPELQQRVQALKHDEEIAKQLMVQQEYEHKRLVCPDDVCEHMISEDEPDDQEETSLEQLFGRMALHQITAHQRDNAWYRNAQKLAAPSFEQAREKVAVFTANAL